PIFSLLLHHFIYVFFFFLLTRPPPISTLFPYTTLFRSGPAAGHPFGGGVQRGDARRARHRLPAHPPRDLHAGRGHAGRRCRALRDRKSTRLNSSHVAISYAVFCLKKKNIKEHPDSKTND